MISYQYIQEHSQKRRSACNGTGSSIALVDVKDQTGSAAITCCGLLDSGNNGAKWTINGSCLGAPTAIEMISFAAHGTDSGVRLARQTGFEIHNLGFHVYWEETGGLERLTPSPMAGSALLLATRAARS